MKLYYDNLEMTNDVILEAMNITRIKNEKNEPNKYFFNGREINFIDGEYINIDEDNYYYEVTLKIDKIITKKKKKILKNILFWILTISTWGWVIYIFYLIAPTLGIVMLISAIILLIMCLVYFLDE